MPCPVLAQADRQPRVHERARGMEYPGDRRSPQGKGTVTAGSAILAEGDSFLVTLDQDLVIPQVPLSLSFTYEATFDTSDPDSIKDAFEAVLTAADGSPLVYNFAPERDAYFNLTEQMPSVLGTGTTEEVVAVGKRVSTDISQIPPGTAGDPDVSPGE